MSKRQPKFKITFTSSVAFKKLTWIVLNGDIVGNICHPGYSTHAPEQFHIELFQRLIGEPHLTSLKPLFSTEKEARGYIKDNLGHIHYTTPLFLSHPPKGKKKLKPVRFGEDWV
tara:strand:- start:362 stop:703 length:342 start_codon:yes stop_codon:yes gene_type:complete